MLWPYTAGTRENHGRDLGRVIGVCSDEVGGWIGIA